jgi:hypothetical protein
MSQQPKYCLPAWISTGDHVLRPQSLFLMVGTIDANCRYVKVVRMLHDHWVEYNDSLVSEYPVRECMVTERIYIILSERAKRRPGPAELCNGARKA